MPHFIYPASSFSASLFSLPEQRRAFSPKFDIYETETAYVLEGDLPGLEKQNLNVEFIDHATLLIKGHTEKSYTRTTPSESPATVGTPDTSRPSSPARSLRATVEDDNENESSSSSKSTETPAKTPVIEKKNEFRHRQWVSERSAGEFQRTFRFPSGIDQDAVTAGLEHGVLKIVVPKREPVTRNIQIQ